MPADAQLNRLLEESPDAARRRAATAFDSIADERGLVLFGAGGLGKRTLAGLRKLGVEPLAFADNNQAAWGTSIDGIAVLAPEQAAGRFGHDAVFVVSIWRAGRTHRFAQTRAQLQALGVQRIAHVGLVFWKYANEFLPYYGMDLPHHVLEQAEQVKAAFRLLGDDPSRRHFVEQIRWRLRMDFENVAPADPGTQYFPPDVVRWSNDETFVDVGAFTGDTLQDVVRLFGPRFRRFVALEPDPLNYPRLVRATEDLPEAVRTRITTREAAVSDAPGTLHIDPSGLASSATGTGSHAVACVTLDEYLPQLGVAPTFIKMDIEGAEPAALRGAAAMIRRYRPILAICAYHAQDHLWSIPLLIDGIAAGYIFYYRTHNEEGWDCVCYAVPPERKLS
jgi:FkbM family methyltransferase